MRYRKLGQTGWDVSEIGFGTWGLGGGSYGTTDDRVSEAALRLAYDLGVNFYDTADLYGDGHSEEILGTTFKRLRDRVIIASKGGTLPHRGFVMPQDFSPAHLREALESSLRRLQTEYIDLYQLHSPPLETLLHHDEIVTTLQRFVREGKIRTYGLSACSPQDALIGVRDLGFAIVQVNFNLIDQRAMENGLLDLGLTTTTGIIIRTPLCFGFLTGAYSESTIFEAGDHRANWPKEQLRRWAEAVGLFKSLCQARCCSAAQLALKWCLSHPGAATVIPGMMNDAEVQENCSASSQEPLNAQEIATIQAIYAAHTFYDPAAKQGTSGKVAP